MRKLMIIMLVLILSIGGTVEAASYPEWREDAPQPERPHLTKSGGVFDGPSGKETYYNLPMGRIITTMRNMGYSVEEYPYYIREDGAKMLGEYVMIACDFDIRPRGTIVETSLGYGLVCDTGGFASGRVTTQIDLAVDW